MSHEHNMPPERESSERTHDCLQATHILDIFATGTAAGLATELVLYPLEHPVFMRGNRAGISLSSAFRVAVSRAPSTGLLMATYELARVGILERWGHSAAPSPLESFTTPFLAGFLATTAESLLLSPLVAIKERTSPFPKALVPRLGMLYKPFPGLVITTAPFVSLYYAFSDMYIARLKKAASLADVPSWAVSAIGGAAGGVTAILVSAPLEQARLGLTHAVAMKPGEDVKWKLTHQPQRFAFRRAFFGILKGAVARGFFARSLGRVAGKLAVRGMLQRGFAWVLRTAVHR
ncbi:hypothetical protein BC830DRAFT_1115313 [Chytriomyces sp. MP71]|nr:hypothetical protein BC830DRAFT_1115313 [Chytriomyces sp. MP71]